jgi:hypothetical protein
VVALVPITVEQVREEGGLIPVSTGQLPVTCIDEHPQDAYCSIGNETEALSYIQRQMLTRLWDRGAL